MKVLIDADGCPVVDISIRLCQKYAIPCFLLCDTSHEFHWDGIQTLIFDKGLDSVDFALVNRIKPGDIVVTQDYGLASMCLARSAKVIHQDGWEYSAENIDALLLARHQSRKIRASGRRIKGQNKRTKSHNEAFGKSFEILLQTSVQG